MATGGPFPHSREDFKQICISNSVYAIINKSGNNYYSKVKCSVDNNFMFNRCTSIQPNEDCVIYKFEQIISCIDYRANRSAGFVNPSKGFFEYTTAAGLTHIVIICAESTESGEQFLDICFGAGVRESYVQCKFIRTTHRNGPACFFLYPAPQIWKSNVNSRTKIEKGHVYGLGGSYNKLFIALENDNLEFDNQVGVITYGLADLINSGLNIEVTNSGLVA